MQSTSLQNNQLTPKKSGFWSLIVLIFLITGGVLLWQNYQNILDWLAYSQFKPPSVVSAMSDRSGMTDSGKYAFYAAQPAIDGTSTFNDQCDRKEQRTNILGCYVGGRIYIFDVKDRRLDGIEEVTATHEMLHAVYQRLSADEKDRINKLLEAEYAKLDDNKEFVDRMAFYARTEPGERSNELHSIIGTEFADVSSELELHYGKYFNRQKVIALYKGYESTFTELSEKAKSLKSQLDWLGEGIEEKSGQYSEAISGLDEDIKAFNAKADSGDFSSSSEFNAERQALLNRVTTVKAMRKSINAMVARYNDLREEYNSLVTQQNDLQKSIDSSLAPAPSV